jgi:hypothetical protein
VSARGITEGFTPDEGNRGCVRRVGCFIGANIEIAERTLDHLFTRQDADLVVADAGDQQFFDGTAQGFRIVEDANYLPDRGLVFTKCHERSPR